MITKEKTGYQDPIQFLLNAQIDKWNEFVLKHPNYVKEIKNYNFDHKNLAGANLQNITFKNISFKFTDLSNSDLTASKFKCVKFFNTNITRTEIKKAIFYQAKANKRFISTIDLKNMRIKVSYKLQFKFKFDNPIYMDDPYKTVSSIISDVENLINYISSKTDSKVKYKLSIEKIEGGCFIVDAILYIVGGVVINHLTRFTMPYADDMLESLKAIFNNINDIKSNSKKNKNVERIKKKCKKHNIYAISIKDERSKHKIDLLM